MAKAKSDKPQATGAGAPALGALCERLEQLSAEAGAREAKLADLSVDNAGLKQEQQARFSELAELTRRIAGAEAELSSTQHALENERNAHQATRDALTNETELRIRAETLATEILHSSAWRLTAPLRWLLGRFRR